MHTHILPGIDDGSRDAECSLKMLGMELEQGIRRVCLSSHYYADESIDDFLAKRDGAYRRLLDAAKKEKAEMPGLALAAEVAYFPGISRCQDLEKLCLQGTDLLLLEMPYSGWQDFEIDEVISLQLDRGLQIVLVHPERLLDFGSNEKQLQRLLKFPIWIQINAASLMPGPLFSRQQARSKTALRLLEEAEHPLLGSDCHNLSGRKPNLLQGIQVLQEKGRTGLIEKIEQTEKRMVK